MRLKFFHKLLVLLTLLSIIIVLGTSFTFNLTAKNVLLKGIGEKSVELAKSAASAIALPYYQDVLQGKIPPAEVREKLTKELLAIQRDFARDGVENIYTIAKRSGGLFIIADSSGDDDPFTVKDDANLALKKSVFAGKADYTKEPYLDQWGTWVSGYAPVRDPSGDIIAIIGVDLPLGAFPLMGRIVEENVLYSLIPTIVLALAMSFLVSKKITNPIREIIAGIKSVEQGNFDLRLDIQSKDELGDMGESFNEMAKGLLEKEKIRDVMNLVVSKEIAEELLNREIRLGGEEREATVLFCDIRGFTSMAETMPPVDVITMLNDYMTAMSACIDNNHGVVDKYVGDEIMALFGVPVTYGNDAEWAVRATVQMRDALRSLNGNRGQEGLEEIRVGMGLNTGTVVAGNMGSTTRLNYTVIGDNVNTASRLCGKAVANQILISESTFRKVRDIAETRRLSPITVKGKSKSVQVYEVVRIRETDT